MTAEVDAEAAAEAVSEQSESQMLFEAVLSVASVLAALHCCCAVQIAHCLSFILVR